MGWLHNDGVKEFKVKKKMIIFLSIFLSTLLPKRLKIFFFLNVKAL